MKKIILYFLFVLVSLSGFGQTRFWGTSMMGGTLIGGTNWGCVYSTDNNGNAQVVEQEITVNTLAKSPTYNNLIQASDGKLYGMTKFGGIDNLGVIYEYNIATGVYITKLSFDGLSKGASPEGGLFQASNGLIYGMTRKGGINDLGVVFEYDPATNVFTKKFDFDGGLAGSEPWGGFMQASNGKLYGMTYSGGIGGKGDLFEFDPVSGILTPKAHFTGTNGANPKADLMEASNGKLYAITWGGGPSDLGVLAEYNIGTNTLVSLYNFTYSVAVRPTGNLLQASDGHLYGLLTHGGIVTGGTICKYNLTTTTFSLAYTFPYPGTYGEPTGSLIEAPNGKLYGMVKGGPGVGAGAIFDFDLATSTYTKDFDFDGVSTIYPQASLVLANDGMMYSVCGGGPGQGTLFQYDYLSNTLINKVNFFHLAHGFSPYSGVVKSMNGKFYGTTVGGGSNPPGVLYEYDPVADTLYTKATFDGPINGTGAMQELIEATNLKLYGVASSGGTSNLGVLYEFDPNTGIYLNKHNFSGPGGTGSYPAGAVVQANNGKLYGMANTTNTTSGNVRIYEYDIPTSTFTVKYSASGATNGQTPCNGMVQALNGKLYGMTKTGGASNMGVIFEYDIVSNTYVKKIDFNGVLKGEQPTGSLILASDGKLYGLATSGGSNGVGTLFEYDPVTNVFTKRIDFTPANGSYPWGTLMQASNGKMYGITNQGGTLGYGTMFEFDPVTGILVNKLNFNSVNGGNNSWKAHLLEATSTPGDNAYFNYAINTHCQAGTNPTPTITGLPGGSFSSSPAGLSINPSTGTINLAASTAGVYGITYLTAGPFPNTHTVYVSVTATPIASFSYSSPTYCPVGSTPLPTLVGIAGTFNAVPAGLSFVSTSTGQVDLVTSTPGTYFVTNTISSTSGCPAIYSSDTILINPKPVVTITPSSHNMCSGGLVTESFSSTVPGTTYTWTATQFSVVGASAGSGPGFSQTLTNTTGSGGTVSYVVTPTANGCVGNNQNCNIFVDDTITIFVNSPSICLGQTATLTGSSTGGLSTTYAWSAGATVTGTNTATATPITTTTYTLTGTKLTCSDTAVATVTVNSALVVSVNSPSVCSGETVTLTAASTGGSGSTTYAWSAGATITGPNTATVSPATNTTYTVTGTSSSCSGTTTSTVTVDAPISVSVNSPSVCLGQPATLTGTSTGGGASTTYTWSAGATITGTNTATVSPTTLTYYTVTGTNLSCIDSAIATVAVDDSISISVNSPSICLGQAATLNYSSVGGGASTSYTWSAGPSVVGIDMASVSPTTTTTYTLTGTNLSCIDTALAIVTVDSCNVWPGDTDNNFIVDNNDLLPIGIYYGASGSPRTIVSNNWQEYPAALWGALQTNGFDWKHVDCNGDGVVDNNDTLAVNLNYSLTHAILPSEPEEQRSSDPDLYFVTSGGPYNAGDWVSIEVWAGTSSTPVSMLYGLAFDIDYDASLVQPASETITYPPATWFGVVGLDAISLSKIDAMASKAYGAFTRISHTNAGGFGRIADFKFQASTSISSDTVFHFSFSGYSANNDAGMPFTFNTIADSIVILPIGTGIAKPQTSSSTVNIYPNPFTNQTTLMLDKEYKNTSIKIVDVLGKEVRTIDFIGKKIVIEKGELNPGVYFIKLISEKEVVDSKKIIIQ